MPLEIRELHIKFTIDESENLTTPNSGQDQTQDELIKAISDRILEILKERQER